MACSSGASEPEAAEGELTGTAVLALAAAPADATCIEVTAVGYRTVKSSFNVAPGASSVFQLTGLPLGQVTFTAQAFGGSCPASGAPNWVSDASFTTTLSVSPPALVTLSLVRNGSANVSIDFNDMPAGGTGAGGGSGNAAGTAGTGTGGSGGVGNTQPSAPIGDLATGVAFMRVPNVKGESVARGFEGWFELTGFGFLATAGTGSPLRWSTTARLRYQAGAPTLYADAAQSTVIGPVDLWFRANAGGASNVVLKVTLTNATIASLVDTGAAGTTPTLALTLGSSRLDVSYSPLRADGTLGPATTAFWDATTNTGSSATTPNLDFTLGAPRPTAQEVTSFRAPSQTAAGSFSDASITAPMSGAILQDLIAAAGHTLVPSGSVQLFKAAADGSVRQYGSYGFKNAAVHTVSFTGPSAATFGFGAEGYTWSVGAETTKFP